MADFFLAGLLLAASGLLMRWLDARMKRPPLIELMRHRGNDASLANYEIRRDALGHGTGRNVRDANMGSVR